MSLATIRTQIKRTTDKIFPFVTGDIDAAVNEWYLTCWKKLDNRAPHRTRTTATLALVKDQETAYTLGFTPLRLLFIQPPDSEIAGRKFVPAVEDRAFYDHEDQTEIWFIQRADTTLLLRPGVDKAFDVTIHYVRTPPTITASVDPLIFSDFTMSAGAIWILLENIDFPDAAKRERRAQRYLLDDINMAGGIGNNSDLIATIDGFTWA